MGVTERFEGDLTALAALAEPARRRLYIYVAPRADAVSRDEAAKAVGMSRALAAFHLDRLVDDGLLETEFRRRTGRTGPGAGRPAKLYRRARGRRVAVSLPQRNDELAARLFAEALDGSCGTDPRMGLSDVAGAYGRKLGERARGAAESGASPTERTDALMAVLTESGYEPRRDEAGIIRLGNCPFDSLVATHRDLTCGMNLSLMNGMLDGLAAAGFEARLDPQPGLCCVNIRPRTQTEADPAPAEGSPLP
ncbi:MAG TPA: hypothetical protein VNF73_10850 [Candidatus Saccharimonadales bacterium]|nr:hypothetical protein [Candidatus Saccharimonadales bacterium]